MQDKLEDVRFLEIEGMTEQQFRHAQSCGLCSTAPATTCSTYLFYEQIINFIATTGKDN